MAERTVTIKTAGMGAILVALLGGGIGSGTSTWAGGAAVEDVRKEVASLQTQVAVDRNQIKNIEKDVVEIKAAVRASNRKLDELLRRK